MWKFKSRTEKQSESPQPQANAKVVDYLAELNPEQRRAVEYGITGRRAHGRRPLLILAGAGTGKTRVLVYRAVHLLANGVRPHRILLLTFTRRAADEMVGRVETNISQVFGARKLRVSWAGTFHAIGLRLLKQYAKQIGLRPSFTILDESDAADLIDLVRNDLKLSDKKSMFPRKEQCLAIYSRTVNSGLSLKKILAKRFREYRNCRRELQELFRKYAAAKLQQNVLDFDDLLLYWSKMLDNSEIAAGVGGMFDHVLVDEYQDTNWLQAEILRKLKLNGRGVAVVGDDAQAIYSWRGATVRNILDFREHFTQPARIIKLERNYRSTQPILHASNLVMEVSKERYVKKLWSDRESKQKPFLTSVLDDGEQARFIAQQILAAREDGVPLKEQAVLFRVAAHTAQLEIELTKRNIPFRKYGGGKFLDAAHIKDVLSVLRWCENRRDRVAGFRMLKLIPGVGPKTASQIIDQMDRTRRVSEAFDRISVPKAAATDWRKFVRMIRQVLRARSDWPTELELLRHWYEPHLRRIYRDSNPRAADLDQLVHVASAYESRDVFLSDLTLDPLNSARRDSSNAELEEPTVLSTIHSAKGQEWRVVRVLNVVDGCMPLSRAGPEDLEEELRLLHVAITRAKDQLDLIVPQHYQTRAGWVSSLTGTSRFVPKSIHSAFDRRDWHDRQKRGERAKRRRSSADVAAAIDEMWRR